MRSRSIGLSLGAALVATALAPACADSGHTPVEVRTTGTVAALVFVDRDGNGDLSNGDAPLQGVTVQLLLPGRTTPSASGTSDALGIVVLRDVPVGRYDATVDAATVPDSLRIEPVDSGTVTVAAGDTARAFFRADYPTLTIHEARAADSGRRLFIVGKMLNSWNTFGDSTISFADTSGFIRGIRVEQTSVQGGDSVRVLGRASTRDGQPVLFDAKVFFLGPAQAPPPISVSTAKAAGADGGSLDAALVSITNATVTDTTTLRSFDFQLTISDGTGSLHLVLDHNVPFSLGVAQNQIVGAHISATGILVPDENGAGWVMKPRTNLDLAVSAGT